MSRLQAFWLGMREFRRSLTTNCGEFDHEYELGRDFAHRCTLRRFEA